MQMTMDVNPRFIDCSKSHDRCQGGKIHKNKSKEQDINNTCLFLDEQVYLVY